MRIFHNPGTRQMIVIQRDQAFSVFLQADEMPVKKAADLIVAYNADKANLSTCQEIILGNTDELLATEDGPEKEEPQRPTEPTNEDGKTA